MGDGQTQEIRITYETLYDLCRREREREEIQELPETFHEDVKSYLEEKKTAWKSYGEKNDIFSSEAQEKVVSHIRNVRKILKQLYERRESKVIALAVNKSRTQSSIIDTSNLLSEEHVLYTTLVALLSEKRTRILGGMLQEEITPSHIPEPEPAKVHTPSGTEVRVLTDITPFSGPELEPYGPFSEGDVKILPDEIANILIKKGQAENVQNE